MLHNMTLLFQSLAQKHTVDACTRLLTWGRHASHAHASGFSDAPQHAPWQDPCLYHSSSSSSSCLVSLQSHLHFLVLSHRPPSAAVCCHQGQLRMLHAAGLSAAASAWLGQTAETVSMAAPAGYHWEYARQQLMTHQGRRWQLVQQLPLQLKSWHAVTKNGMVMTAYLRLRSSCGHLL